MTDNRFAAPGQMWRCSVCGRLSDDRYGTAGWHSNGWNTDHNCTMNAQLITLASQTITDFTGKK